jgi:uncharacterized protein (DUF433 family)
MAETESVTETMTADMLIRQYIEADPARPGKAEARLVDSCVPVWALIGHYQGDAERVARDYGVPLDAVKAALAFYHRHREIIDDRLAANRPPADE